MFACLFLLFAFRSDWYVLVCISILRISLVFVVVGFYNFRSFPLIFSAGSKGCMWWNGGRRGGQGGRVSGTDGGINDFVGPKRTPTLIRPGPVDTNT